MFCKVLSGIVYGVTGVLIHVEVDIRSGLPYFTMVGHLSRESKEAKERVESALRSTGIPIPPQRITINLSPADLKKSGTAFDFPIAVAIMNCLGMIPSKIDLTQLCILGELGLDGSVHSIQQSLPIILEAKKHGIKTFLVSYEDYEFLSEIDDVSICPMRSLSDVILYFSENKVKIPDNVSKTVVKEEYDDLDFFDVKGQAFLKRAIEIAVTGHHNLLMIGSPGSGKTMLAHRIPSILLPLSKEERLEVDAIYCASSMYRQGDASMPPFRMPHHSITPSAFIGGGAIPKAGEITLAHRGILYLDELSEFKTSCLEALRIPLEEKKIVLNRLGRNYTFPCDILVIATMNPCPCGEGFTREKCRCTPAEVRRYYKKLSSPFLDRFDMILPVMKNDFEASYGESSKVIRERVKDNTAFLKCESSIHIKKEAKEILKEQRLRENISMRGYDKIISVAKTIAAMDHQKEIKEKHMMEALAYRDIGFFREVMQYDE